MDQETSALIVFGITGHLSLTKLLPSLKYLRQKQLLPKNFSLIGIGRRDLPQELNNFISEITNSFVYIQEDLTSELLYARLYQQLKGIDHQIYFLATFPELYQTVIHSLAKYNLHKEEKKWIKILIEKPLGFDSESAKDIIHTLTNYFDPDQIYPIDHYLGKDPVQNILAFRFGNPIFEELINRNFVDNIQITGAEDFGIENRGRFYDKTGALKDVGQNHILQLLTFATMDKPKSVEASDIHQARINLLERIRPVPNSLTLGQYQGYLTESDVYPNSQTDTYFALEARIDNQRFKDVPIYLRAGKHLPMRVTEINIVFKKLPNYLFPKEQIHSNVLTYRVQPNEGIVLNLDTKKPGFSMELEPTFMQYCYKDYTGKIPDPYEKLILDAFWGDKTWFPTLTEIELQWRIIDQALRQKPAVQVYQPKTWGPIIYMPFLEPSPLVCKI